MKRSIIAMMVLSMLLCLISSIGYSSGADKHAWEQVITSPQFDSPAVVVVEDDAVMASFDSPAEVPAGVRIESGVQVMNSLTGNISIAKSRYRCPSARPPPKSTERFF